MSPAESNRETNRVFNKTSKSISSVGKSIGEGMALLAAALNTQQPTKIANFQNHKLQNRFSVWSHNIYQKQNQNQFIIH